MTPELIISIISLCLTTACSVLTVMINLRISKINNLEANHKFNKEITAFELRFKDAAGLEQIMKSGEFANYNSSSKMLIYEWWKEYEETHKPKTPKVTIPKSKRFGKDGKMRKAYEPLKERPEGRFPTVVAIPSEITIGRAVPPSTELSDDDMYTNYEEED